MPLGAWRNERFNLLRHEAAGRHDLSPRWVSFLAASQIESVHWSFVGAATAPDSEIMAYARAHGYVVLTHDLDFSAILAATQGTKTSVVQIRSESLNPDIIGAHVLSAVRQLGGQLQSGALVSVEPDRTKMRLLPL
jgi:predicted nuclease of predicted toxin-antitoxin system